MCGCKCPYGTFPACRVNRAGKPCYLEDDSYATDMDDADQDQRDKGQGIRDVFPRYGRRQGQHAGRHAVAGEACAGAGGVFCRGVEGQAALIKKGWGAMNIAEHYWRQGHEYLWHWLAENPSKVKDDWPGWSMNGGPYYGILNKCFACGFADLMYVERGAQKNKYYCDYCPLNQRVIFRCEEVSESVWYKWCKATDIPRRAQLAGKIRDAWRASDV